MAEANRGGQLELSSVFFDWEDCLQRCKTRNCRDHPQRQVKRSPGHRGTCIGLANCLIVPVLRRKKLFKPHFFDMTEAEQSAGTEADYFIIEKASGGSLVTDNIYEVLEWALQAPSRLMPQDRPSLTDWILSWWCGENLG
jgi:hypothetical protein